jgi:alcohol dehydrogenase
MNPEFKEKKMDKLKEKARTLISEFKGEDYVCGLGCLGNIGELVKPHGQKVLLITNLHRRDPENFQTLLNSLESTGLDVKGPFSSARPNSPKEDVLKIKEVLLHENPECVVVASGGSGIDAAKAAVVLAILGGDIEDYFGVGKSQISKHIRKNSSWMRLSFLRELSLITV